MNRDDLISKIVALMPDVPGFPRLSFAHFEDVDDETLVAQCKSLELLAEETASFAPFRSVELRPDVQKLSLLRAEQEEILTRLNTFLDSVGKSDLQTGEGRKSMPSHGRAVPAQRVATKTMVAPKTSGGVTPIKDTFTKASLAAHLAERAGVEPASAKAVLAALEDTILAAVHKKGAGEFTLSGLLKIAVQAAPAKKKRFGKDPFIGEDRWLPEKPRTVRIKARALKKLKDAANS